MVQDLVGKRYGRLVVISRADNNCHGDVMWKCRCDCGNFAVVRANSLRSGKTKSCGCLQKNVVANMKRTHGLSNTRLFRIWQAMKQRCYNEKKNYYELYGGKGISVCDEWKADFLSFYNWSMANGYDDSKSIDRIDSAKNYSPDNCRWASPSVQSSNKRDNNIVFYHGMSDTFTGMCRTLNVNRSTIQKRCRIYDCTFEEAVDNYGEVGEFVDHWKKA